MAATPQTRPNRFSIDIAGQEVGMFHELSGMTWEAEVKTYETNFGTGSRVTKREIGNVKVVPATLKSYNVSKSLWAWFQEAWEKGPDAAKEASVIVYDNAGKEKQRVNLYGAWPSKLSIPGLDVGASEPLEVEIEIQFDTFKLVGK